MSHPYILGLTGSIGMGKSTVAGMFVELGVPVFDADAEVHKMQLPGGALVAPIEAAFPGTTGPFGVDRPKLGGLVFGNDSALDRLQRIVHPAVGDAREAFLIEHGRARLVVFDLPLLFEANLRGDVSGVLVVSADAETQRRRVLARPGVTPERFAAVLQHQMSDAEKRARADFVIDTGHSLAETRKEVAALVAKLTQ